jgi:hypothetical protein
VPPSGTLCTVVPGGRGTVVKAQDRSRRDCEIVVADRGAAVAGVIGGGRGTADPRDHLVVPGGICDNSARRRMHVDDPPGISASRSWDDERPVKEPNPGVPLELDWVSVW